MEQQNIILFCVLVFLVPAGLVIAVYFPTIAMAMFFAFYPLKINLLLIMPYLHGWVGFLADGTVAAIALLSIVILRNKDPDKVPLFSEKKAFGFWFLFILITIFGLLITRDFESGIQKALIFSIIGTIHLLMGVGIASSTICLRKTITAAIWVGLIFTILLLTIGRASQEYEGARKTIGYSNVLALSDIIAYMVIMLFSTWLGRRQGIYRKTALYIIPFGVFAILLAGSRGAVVVLALSSLYLLWGHRKNQKIGMMVGIIIVGLGVHFAINMFSQQAESQRFGSEEFQKGLGDRWLMAQATLRDWSKSLLIGRGTGDISLQLTGVVGERNYPHNLPLEVFNELGLIGFLIYAYIFYRGCRVFWLAQRFKQFVPNDYLYIVRCCFFMHLLFAFKTGSYGGGNLIYFFLGTAIGLVEFTHKHYLNGLQENEEEYPSSNLPDIKLSPNL